MSGKKVIGTSGVGFLIALVCMAALAVWLSSASGLTASAPVPANLTFVSPIGDPRLSLAKRVDNSAPVPGSQINYTLSYSNTKAGSQAFNVRLYDFLPAGVQFLSSNPPVTPDANGVLLFTVPSVGPGTEDHSVTVQARVLEGYPQLRNYGVIAADAVTPTYATLVTSVSQPLPGQLRVSKTGYPAVLVNGQLVYVLRCENGGAATLADVSLVDVLPTGVSLSAASPAPNTAALPLLRWSLGDLAPGASRSVVVTTTAPPVPGVITNTAIADTRQSVMTTTQASTLVITQGAILHVVKGGSAERVSVGDKLVYTLRYGNRGDTSATGVILTDTLPAGVTLVGASPTPDDASSQLVVWRRGQLDAGIQDQAVITVTVGGPVGRILHNVVDITGEPDAIPAHFELDIAVKPYLIYLPVVLR